MPWPVPGWLSLDSGSVPRARAGTFEEGTAAVPGASTDWATRWSDYSEVSWQWLRGAHMLEAGLVTFHIHLGLYLTDEDRAEASRPV